MASIFLYFCLNDFLMRNRPLILFCLILTPCLFSCRTYKPIMTSVQRPQSVSDYVGLYKDLAINEMNRTGIPASITLAQGIIESDCGRSSLARDANNHFGIKCHDNWKGPTVRHDDNKRNECFRKYRKAEESFWDHSDFLKSASRYDFLFKYKNTDYKAWAHGLRKAGYATNPDYANMLIRTIEENDLWTYDSGRLASATGKVDTGIINDKRVIHSGDSAKKIQVVMTSAPVLTRAPRVMENNRVRYIVVKDGDTREKLEEELQLLKWELPKYNELKSDFVPQPGQILYLQPKRDKAEPGKEYYIVTDGDTMYNISQKYGIKLKKLYEMNRMPEGTEPEPGKKIWLRSSRPVN